MTESEAKEIIENTPIFRCEADKTIHSDLFNALAYACIALEKQIPKKPHKNFEKFSGVWCACGNYLGKGYFVDKPSYCPDCGQKLDWSDDE